MTAKPDTEEDTRTVGELVNDAVPANALGAIVIGIAEGGCVYPMFLHFVDQPMPKETAIAALEVVLARLKSGALLREPDQKDAN